MAQKWIGAWGKNFQRGCLYRFIAVLIVIPLFTVCILIPLYFANRPGVTDSEFLLIMIIPAVLFLVVLFGGGYGFLAWSKRKRSNWLDQIFLPFGLEGRRYATTGRQYHGRVHGREIDVLFVRGPMLSIYISTEVYTRASFSDSEDVSQRAAAAFNKTPLDSGMADLTVYAYEDEWGQNFINEPEVQSLLRDLIFDESPFYIRQVQLEPGYIMLRLYRSNKMFDFAIPPEQGKKWVEQLLGLAELAEQQEAPKESLPASKLGEDLREGKVGKLGLVIAAVVVVLSLCVGLVAIGVVFLAESGG